MFKSMSESINRVDQSQMRQATGQVNGRGRGLNYHCRTDDKKNRLFETKQPVFLFWPCSLENQQGLIVLKRPGVQVGTS